MSVHFLLLHDRTFEKKFLLLAAIREFDDIDTKNFQALSSRQASRHPERLVAREQSAAPLGQGGGLSTREMT